MIDFINAHSISTNKGNIIKITRNNEILWQRPYKRQVMYIEATSGQYIDIGLKATGNTDVYLEFNGNLVNIFGSRSSWSSNAFSLNAGGGKRAFNYGNYSQSVNLTSTISQTDNEWHKVSMVRGGICTIDSWSKTYGKYTFTTPNNLILFGCLTNGVMNSDSGSAKLSYFKMYEDGILVRDMIPVLDHYDIPCMYDKVTNQLFYNNGTGEFIYKRSD